MWLRLSLARKTTSVFIRLLRLYDTSRPSLHEGQWTWRKPNRRAIRIPASCFNMSTMPFVLARLALAVISPCHVHFCASPINLYSSCLPSRHASLSALTLPSLLLDLCGGRYGGLSSLPRSMVRFGFHLLVSARFANPGPSQLLVKRFTGSQIIWVLSLQRMLPFYGLQEDCTTERSPLHYQLCLVGCERTLPEPSHGPEIKPKISTSPFTLSCDQHGKSGSPPLVILPSSGP